MWARCEVARHARRDRLIPLGDRFVLIASGTAGDVEWARATLVGLNAKVDVHHR